MAICVGHQVLFSAGIEHGVRSDGCGIWPGRVEALHATRLPHMGWNTVQAADDSHPEKSGDAGARLIANWVATL